MILFMLGILFDLVRGLPLGTSLLLEYIVKLGVSITDHCFQIEFNLNKITFK